MGFFDIYDVIFSDMGRYKISSRIIVLTIVLLIVLAGIVFYEVPFGSKDINDVYRDNPGKIWLIGLVGTFVFSLLMYWVLISTNTLQAFLKTIDEKNDIIKAQSDQIIATLEYNAKRHDELMVKINHNDEKDIERDRRIGSLESDVKDIKKHIGL